MEALAAALSPAAALASALGSSSSAASTPAVRTAVHEAAGALGRLFEVLRHDTRGPLPLGCGAALYEALAGPLVSVSKGGDGGDDASMDSGSDTEKVWARRPHCCPVRAA